MQEWILDSIKEYGYIIVLLLIMIENIFPPIPSEVILTAGGFMTTIENATMGVWGLLFRLPSARFWELLFYIR